MSLCKIGGCTQTVRRVIDYHKPGVWLDYQPGLLRPRKKSDDDEEKNPKRFFHLSEEASDGLCYHHFKSKNGLYDWVPLHRRSLSLGVKMSEVMKGNNRRRGGGWEL